MKKFPWVMYFAFQFGRYYLSTLSCFSNRSISCKSDEAVYPFGALYERTLYKNRVQIHVTFITSNFCQLKSCQLTCKRTKKLGNLAQALKHFATFQLKFCFCHKFFCKGKFILYFIFSNHFKTNIVIFYLFNIKIYFFCHLSNLCLIITQCRPF